MHFTKYLNLIFFLAEFGKQKVKFDKNWSRNEFEASVSAHLQDDKMKKKKCFAPNERKRKAICKRKN